MMGYQLQRENIKYIKYLSYPLPFYATQIISPFLKSRISANQDKVEEDLVNAEILIKGIEIPNETFWQNQRMRYIARF